MDSMRKYISALLMIILAVSCDKPYVAEPLDSMVIEGWIDSYCNPVVQVTRTVPLTEKEKTRIDDLKDYVVTWAKVMIADGTDTTVLYSRRNDAYFPPFIYTTHDLTGQPGHTYSLIVVADGDTAWAQTTIPANAPQVKDITYTLEPDGAADVNVIISDPATPGDRYKVFSSERKGWKQLHSSIHCQMWDNNSASAGELSIPVTRKDEVYDLSNRSAHYSAGDTLSIKVSTLTESSYRLWEAINENVSFRLFFMSPVNRNVNSNVNGALGYWCGYNSLFFSKQLDAE